VIGTAPRGGGSAPDPVTVKVTLFKWLATTPLSFSTTTV
jgi:hypothetical protein